MVSQFSNEILSHYLKHRACKEQDEVHSQVYQNLSANCPRVFSTGPLPVVVNGYIFCYHQDWSVSYS